MTRRIIAFCTIIACIFVLGLTVGCSNKSEVNEKTQAEPEVTAEASETEVSSETDVSEAPTLSPDITHPEGQFLDTTPPRMEGLVTAIDKDTITLKILDVEYKLMLSDRAKEEIEIYKDKFNTPVQVGSFLQIPYEQIGNGYVANNILFVKSN